MSAISKETLKAIKECLFGLQKQANVINDAVVVLVAKELANSGYTSFNTSEEVKDVIEKYLQSIITDANVSVNKDFLMLIVGPQGVANIEAVGPKMVYVDKPSVESPKWIFRIHMLGEDAAVEHEAHEGEAAIHVSKPAVSPDEVYSPSDDFYTRACKIKDAILPMVPDAVKAEIKDNEFAQALCCAEYFYGYGK